MALYVVTGSPGCGKSTWVRATAKPGDIRFDSDAMTNLLTGKAEGKHHHDNVHAKISRAAREAGIREAIKHRNNLDIYLLKSNLNRQDEMKWRRYGARFIIIDPGYEQAKAWCKASRPGYKHRLVDAWYERRDEWPRDAQIIHPEITNQGDELARRLRAHGHTVTVEHQGIERREQKKAAAPRNDRTARGYGREHKHRRQALINGLVDGTPCWWCNLPMHGDLNKTRNWDGFALAADHEDARGAASGTQAGRLLHFTCNSQRQDGSNDHLRPALTGRHPSEPLGTSNSAAAFGGFDFGGVTFA